MIILSNMRARTVSLLLFCVLAFNDLDAQSEPQLLSKPDLQFPNQAYTGRVVGKVWLKILVGEDGIPVKTAIIKREPEMAFLFDDNSRKWGMHCKFKPATDYNGKAVAAWVVTPLSYGFDHFTPPQCLRVAKPKYPDDAREMGMEGWVGLAVLVKSNDEVNIGESVVVAREPENATVFDAAAKEAALHSRYIAASYESNAIEGWCFIKVTFKIDGRGAYDTPDDN
jgi:outer membrane biosynthesis protein TonB